MDKGLRLVAAIMLTTCVSVVAQERPIFQSTNLLNSNIALATGRAATVGDGFVTLASTYAPPGPLSLINDDPFAFMQAFAWTSLTPRLDLPPLLIGRPALLAVHPLESEMRSHPVELQSSSGYVWGEMGGLYGTTVGGRASLEAKEGYIIGGFSNDRTEITVGASYSDWRGSLPGNIH